MLKVVFALSRNAALTTSFWNIQVHMQSDTSSYAKEESAVFP